MTTNREEVSDKLLLEGVALFKEKFSATPELAVFGPGRANLIGEHTDYNDGFVLPFAIPYRTIIVGSRTTTELCTIISKTFPGDPVSFKADGSLCKGAPAWANYVKGTVAQYTELLPPGAAFNAVIVSNVPLGGGLSSSAALEVATATFLEELYSLPRQTEESEVQKALRCQKAEHTFADVPCGIMDQFISAMGKEGHLLLIDCRSKKAKLVPAGSGPSSPVILITNSNVKHELTGSEYPDRVNQCRAAVAALQKHFPDVQALRDVTLAQLEHVKHELDDTVYRRARHVISENQRTLDAVDAITAKDYLRVGELMIQSHASLRDDYEVSCEELDFLVRTAQEIKGVYGSRMTGGGFGGCTVTLVDKHAVRRLTAHLRESYQKQFNRSCDCYEAAPAAGAGRLMIPTAPARELRNWVHYIIPAAAAALSAVVALNYFSQPSCCS